MGGGFGFGGFAGGFASQQSFGMPFGGGCGYGGGGFAAGGFARGGGLSIRPIIVPIFLGGGGFGGGGFAAGGGFARGGTFAAPPVPFRVKGRARIRFRGGF
jgi:hypothetical protein